MGTIVLKVSGDLYVEYSTVSNGLEVIGDRDGFLKYLTGRGMSRDAAERMLARADKTGTSSSDGVGAWGNGFFVQKHHGRETGAYGWLPRAQLARFVDEWRKSPARAERLLAEHGR